MLARHAEHLATRFGCGAVSDLRGPVARGEQGEVWQLTATSGTWALKVLYEKPSDGEAQADAAYQDAVRITGVPMPRVMRTVDGKVLVHVDGYCVRAYEWIEMCDLDARLEPSVVGELVASIHSVRSVCGRRPVDPWYFEPVGAKRWDEVFSALESGGAPDGMSLGAMREELAALEQLLAPARDLQVCHRDLWAENVRRTPGGGMCVIDWENGGLADPSQELGAVLFEYGLDDPTRVRCIYDAYVEGGGPGRIQGRGDFSMLIAQLGHIFEWACTRWIGASSEADRARAADSIREFARRPVTRDVVDRLLASTT